MFPLSALAVVSRLVDVPEPLTVVPITYLPASGPPPASAPPAAVSSSEHDVVNTPAAMSAIAPVIK